MTDVGRLVPVDIENAAQSANTDFGSFTATRNANADIFVGVSASATLTLTALGQSNSLNSGALTAGEWYTWNLPVVAGKTYVFKASAACNVSMVVQY